MKAIILSILIALAVSLTIDDDIDNDWECKGCIWLFKSEYRKFCEPHPTDEDYASQSNVANDAPPQAYVEFCRKCSQNITEEDCKAYFELRAEENKKEEKIKKCFRKCLAMKIKIDCDQLCIPPKPMH